MANCRHFLLWENVMAFEVNLSFFNTFWFKFEIFLVKLYNKFWFMSYFITNLRACHKNVMPIGCLKSIISCSENLERIFRSILGGKMKYKVHRIEVKSENMQDKLEQFLNKLDGEVLSVIPNVKPTFQFMGATAKVDFLLIVEKVK